jgi:hypothetical protein
MNSTPFLKIGYTKSKPDVAVYNGWAADFQKQTVAKGKTCYVATTDKGDQIVHDMGNTVVVFHVGSNVPVVWRSPLSAERMVDCRYIGPK